MAEKSLKFLVVFFSKNRRLFLALGATLAIVAVAGILLSFTDWFPLGQHKQALAWTVVVEEENWQGEPSEADLPRYFVAGGAAFDRQILVDGWGMPEEILRPLDYMEELGIHVLLGQVNRVLYSGNKLQVYIDEKDSGYQLITVAKGDLHEGDLQIVFLNDRGTALGYEEEYVYSVPLEFTLVDSGPADTKGKAFMEILDLETLPVLTGYSPSFLSQHADCLLLFIQGAKVSSVQRNETSVRIYTEEDAGFQVVTVAKSLLKTGQNTVRLIDSTSLQVISQVVYLISD